MALKFFCKLGMQPYQYNKCTTHRLADQDAIVSNFKKSSSFIMDPQIVDALNHQLLYVEDSVFGSHMGL